MTATALAAVAGGSGLQLALYLHFFATTRRTDGFIAAFAVYSLLVVMAQTMRTTAVPLITGEVPRLAGADFGWALVFLAALTGVGLEALAEPISHAVAGGDGPAGRHVALVSLRVMAPAATLQLLSAGLAVGGAVRGRLVPVSVAYIGSAVVGLICFMPLHAPAAQSVLAWTALVASVALLALLVALLGAPTLTAPRFRLLARALVIVLRDVPLPVSFVVMYPVTLALVGHPPPGAVTSFGLAFTACSYLAGFTGQGFSMVDAVTHAELAAGDAAARGRLVNRAFRFALLVAAPAFAAVVALGPPVVEVLAGGGHATRAGFRTDLLLLAPWTAATIALWSVLSAWLSSSLAPAPLRLLSGVAALLALHVGVSLLARGVWGLHGLIVALAAAPLAFVLLAATSVLPRGAALILGRDLLLILVAASATFGIAALVAAAVLGGGVLAGLVALLLGVPPYAALALKLFPEIRRRVGRRLLLRA